MSHLKLIPAASAIALLTGCATTGYQQDFACAPLDGVTCASVEEVYEASANGETPKANYRYEGNKVVAVDEDVDRFASDNLAMVKSGDSIEIEPMVSSASQPAIPQAQPADDFVTVSLDKPVPIRTPAKVMRIWVAPYQTTDGSLVASGYVFSEIEPRRWSLGDAVAAGSSSPVFQPLDVPVEPKMPETDSTVSGFQPVSNK